MEPITMSDLVFNKCLWRFVGFGSSIVGFSCYVVSPSFKNLFGEWDLLKIIIYSLVSFIFSCFILFANRWRLTRSSLLKAHVCFLVLMVTSVYSYYQDESEEKAENGHGRMLSLISFGAFALMSLSVSRQIELKFEVGAFNFFLGCVMVMVMKMNMKIALGAAAFCYVLTIISSYSDSQLENQVDSQHLIIDLDNTSHQQPDTEIPQESRCFRAEDMGFGIPYDYDPEIVFLSYAVEDSFAVNLLGALRRRNIKTYSSNEEIKIGSRRSLKLHRQIEGSQVSVVIFSRNYANSKWRLTELDKIMDCKKIYGQIVIPIFQDIDPSKVKNQKGSYLDAFAKHEHSFHRKALQRWKADLTKAANLPNSWNLFLPRMDLGVSYIVEAIADDVKRKIELSIHKSIGSNSGVENVLRKRRMLPVESALYDAVLPEKVLTSHAGGNNFKKNLVDSLEKHSAARGQRSPEIARFVEHAKTSVLSGKIYVYHSDDSMNVGVVFNNIYELNGLFTNGQYYSADCLSESQKVYVDTLVKKAYEDWIRVKRVRWTESDKLQAE